MCLGVSHAARVDREPQLGVSRCTCGQRATVVCLGVSHAARVDSQLCSHVLGSQERSWSLILRRNAAISRGRTGVNNSALRTVVLAVDNRLNWGSKRCTSENEK